MRIVLLDSFPADQGAPGWQALSQLGELVVHPRTRPDQLLERAAGAEALVTNKVVLDADTLGRLPQLRYIGVCATGTNVVDLDAARQRGIAVTNVPGYGPESVAQAVFAAALHFAHDVAAHDTAVKAGDWARSPDFCFFRKPLFELARKRMVIVGLGAIGRAVARIARGFLMEVAAAAVPGSPTGEGRVDLAELLPRADIVSLHCPLTPATSKLVDAAFLARLPAQAILINFARGGLIDETALLASLRAGHLGGVALDVLTHEPPPADHPLTDPRAPFAGRVLVTPHYSWGTVEARARLRAEVTENLAAFQRGDRRNRVG
jgi:glycerate dehydrogenase